MSDSSTEEATEPSVDTGATADPLNHREGRKAPAEKTDEEIEAEREEKLAPENRPEGAEVDNTDREFDVKHGRFTDTEPDEELGPFDDPLVDDDDDDDDDEGED